MEEDKTDTYDHYYNYNMRAVETKAKNPQEKVDEQTKNFGDNF